MSARLHIIQGGLRTLVILFCFFAIWQSTRTALADWLAGTGRIEDLEHAIRLEPDNGTLLARAALYRSESGDSSPDVERDLIRASKATPLNPEVLMTLGLRAEFRGDRAAAERYLTTAAEMDRQFKPAWALANFYFRNDQSGKFWLAIQHILHLEPLAFDLGPVFELCWKATGDPDQILRLIPARGPKPVQYFDYLSKTRRIDAAIASWPKALAAVDGTDAASVRILDGFPDLLIGADRTSDAVRVWNQLVDRGFVVSGRLDPATGDSVADPNFKFPPLALGFGWREANPPDVPLTPSPGSFSFELSGDQPPDFQFLSAYAPVTPAKTYRLVWESDGAMLDQPQNPGFYFAITQLPMTMTTACGPLLAARENAGCTFVTLPGNDTLRIDLRYTRVAGTTHPSGTLGLSSTRLEFVK